jgi:predicted acyl esterase
MKGKYIMVYQDVRGRYMSEGNFREMTPHDSTRKQPDESSDTYDTY